MQDHVKLSSRRDLEGTMPYYNITALAKLLLVLLKIFRYKYRVCQNVDPKRRKGGQPVSRKCSMSIITEYQVLSAEQANARAYPDKYSLQSGVRVWVPVCARCIALLFK